MFNVPSLTPGPPPIGEAISYLAAALPLSVYRPGFGFLHRCSPVLGSTSPARCPWHSPSKQRPTPHEGVHPTLSQGPARGRRDPRGLVRLRRGRARRARLLLGAVGARVRAALAALAGRPVPPAPVHVLEPRLHGGHGCTGRGGNLSLHAPSRAFSSWPWAHSARALGTPARCYPQRGVSCTGMSKRWACLFRCRCSQARVARERTSVHVGVIGPEKGRVVKGARPHCRPGS